MLTGHPVGSPSSAPGTISMSQDTGSSGYEIGAAGRSPQIAAPTFVGRRLAVAYAHVGPCNGAHWSILRSIGDPVVPAWSTMPHQRRSVPPSRPVWRIGALPTPSTPPGENSYGQTDRSGSRRGYRQVITSTRCAASVHRARVFALSPTKH